MRQPKCDCGACKYCKNLDATRRYRERHRDRISGRRNDPAYQSAKRERDRRYRERHPDRVKAASERYYRSHVAECRAALRRWRKANPDKARAQSRRYREAHLEERRAANRAFMREFYRQNRDEINRRSKERRDSQIATARAKERRRALAKYGLTQADYDRMVAQQDHGCAICHQTVEGNLHVDHCHTSGKVRGLLCGACNTSIGSFRDNPATLRRAADYLEGVHPWGS